MVVKHVLDAEKLEWKGYEENIVRRVAPLNDMEAAPKVDPPRVHYFPEQGTPVFPKIADRGFPFFGHRMSINVNTCQVLIALFVALAFWTQNGNLVTGFVK